MVVQVKNLTKKIKENVVLDNISVKMESGYIYGISGINGSGKTMFMRALCGLILPTEGEIVLNDKYMGKDLSFPESVGLLLENPAFLSSYTGFKNLKILASIKGVTSDEQIRKTLEDVGLDPEDKRKYKKYSLGMKQRLGIACAILENPDLIILDEPFNALDEEGCKLVESLLLRLKKQGKLILLSCHDKEQLYRLSDHIFEMRAGKLSVGETV